MSDTIVPLLRQTSSEPAAPSGSQPGSPGLAEPAWRRWAYGALATLVVVGFFITNAVWWVPAHPGVDQNGYLVGGRMLAENLTMKLAPARPGSQAFDPHQFVGRMWIGVDLLTPQERYYPKYPIGYPALIAVALWIGGDNWGPILAYWINPLAMTLAVAAMYLLARTVAGSFWALCATVVLASSPVVMGLTTNPNSHATATCCVAWGMYLLIRWWQAMKLWRALGAGLLIGYAALIRYTEAALVLPILLVIVLSARKRDIGWWKQVAALLIGWAVPVGVLVWHNLAALGKLTGYDGTNESLGFSWQYAADNWETTLRHFGSVALYFVFPFSVLGLLMMLWRSWRMGLLLAAWIVPCAAAYTFYYWAPDPVQVQQQQPLYISYMRFFVTTMPALVMSAYWLLEQIGRYVSTPTASPWAPRAARLVTGLVTWIALAVHLQNSTFNAELDQSNRLMLQVNAAEVLETAPAGSVIFAQEMNLLHHLQFVRDYALYSGETFNKSWVERLTQVDLSEPQAFEYGRREAIYNRFKDYSQPQLDEDGRRLIATALQNGRRVFFIVPRREADPPVRRRVSGELRGAGPAAELLRRWITPDRFNVEIVAAWNQPIVRPPQAIIDKPRARRVETRVDRRATFWQIAEVTTKPREPPTIPATRAAATRSGG